MRVLITTTSFQDTPGEHHELLDNMGWEVTTVRGPLGENDMLDLVGDFDAIICGDDVYSREVLEKARPKLRFLSKYGIGVDKIDVDAATEMGLPVFFTPGVNHTTVAEHVFGLMLAHFRQLIPSVNHTRAGEWKRLTGHEIMGKTLGILGLGRIGREVAMRAKAFDMPLMGYDIYWPEAFANEYQIERVDHAETLLQEVDVLTLHCNLTEETRDLLNERTLGSMKRGALIVNCARGEIVDTAAMVKALDNEQIGGYVTDVLDEEPPPSDHPLLNHPKCLCTPHIGSRTYESVVRQATKAIKNLELASNKQEPLAQVNEVPIS